MDEKINFLHRNKNWKLVLLPLGKKPIRCMWVYANMNNSTRKGGLSFKARLVAMGYAQ